MSLAGRTVIYGGSFNPPHMSHQLACLYLLEALEAQAVWLVPAANHPFGKPLAPFADRVAMCRLIAAPLGSRVTVSEVEQQLGGLGRTYDTLMHLMQTHPDRRFALAVGADILREVHAWHRWSDIEAALPVVVLGRAGHPHPRAMPVALPEVSSSMLRERLGHGESVEGYVPAAVARYLREHALYGVGRA